MTKPASVDLPPCAEPTSESSAHKNAGKPPTCFVIDRDPAHRHFMLLVLQGHGIETTCFTSTAELADAMASTRPDLICLDVSSIGAGESISGLAIHGYRGTVQPMSINPITGFDLLRQQGERAGIAVMPALKKPLDRGVIRHMLAELKLDIQVSSAAKVELDVALREGWIEFWYQPKIDLRRKRLIGVELFARARHPRYGVVAPGAFMADADERSILTLTEMSVIDALNIGRKISELGTRLKLAVNVSVGALTKLPLPEILREHRSPGGHDVGLILDITEDEVASDFSLVREIHAELRASGIGFAIDDFGRGYVPLARLQELPQFAEFKLNRGFVADCGSDQQRAALCRAVISVAHNCGSNAIGVGVEKPADAHALFRMGCDFGQGYLFAQPMTGDRFYALLRQRRPAALNQPAA